MDWQFAGVGALLAASAFYALRLSARSKLQKLGHNRRKQPGISSGGEKELM